MPLFPKYVETESRRESTTYIHEKNTPRIYAKRLSSITSEYMYAWLLVRKFHYSQYPSLEHFLLAINLALYCSLFFLRKTHLQFITLEYFGTLTNVHVWFLFKDSVSYSMVIIHLPWSCISIASYNYQGLLFLLPMRKRHNLYLVGSTVTLTDSLNGLGFSWVASYLSSLEYEESFPNPSGLLGLSENSTPFFWVSGAKLFEAPPCALSSVSDFSRNIESSSKITLCCLRYSFIQDPKVRNLWFLWCTWWRYTS